MCLAWPVLQGSRYPGLETDSFKDNQELSYSLIIYCGLQSHPSPPTISHLEFFLPNPGGQGDLSTFSQVSSHSLVTLRSLRRGVLIGKMPPPSSPIAGARPSSFMEQQQSPAYVEAPAFHGHLFCLLCEHLFCNILSGHLPFQESAHHSSEAEGMCPTVPSGPALCCSEFPADTAAASEGFHCFPVTSS